MTQARVTADPSDGAPWAPADATAHRPACLRLARVLLRDEHLAEDAVQEAFLDAWKHRARFDPARATLRSWLLMLTHRRAVDLVRDVRRHGAETPASTEQLLRDETAFAEDPATVVSRAERVANVRAALLALPAAQREVLVLAYWGGYTQREIAELTDYPLGTVKTRCHSGMRRMRVALQTTRSQAEPAGERPVAAEPAWARSA